MNTWPGIEGVASAKLQKPIALTSNERLQNPCPRPLIGSRKPILLMATGRRWTRDELLIAMNVYRKLTFGQLHSRNPVIIGIAQKLTRTPDSVAMKLCNLASLDTTLKERGIKGLEGASNLDREVWQEFHDNIETLGPQSEEAFRQIFRARESDEVEVDAHQGVRLRRGKLLSPPEGPTDRTAQIKVRRGQQFFRQIILNAFDRQCCVTGINIPEFLIASHILPWRDFPAERLNPGNGLCLSRLHDAAFDEGLMTFDENLRVVLSRKLKSRFPHRALETSFSVYEGERLKMSSDVPPPRADFLKYHREIIFES